MNDTGMGAIPALSIVVTVVLVLCAFFYFSGAWGGSPKIIENKEYREYETTLTIAEKWQDTSLVGEKCDSCGCADAPLVIKASDLPGMYITPNKCKWCAELDNLSYHLRYNTTRR